MNNHICKAKSLGTGEWVQGYYVQKTDPILGIIYTYLVTQGHDEWTKTQLSSFVTWYQVDPDTVCRYTGLKDKNNNPIFENDIALIRDSFGAFEVCVHWDQACAIFEIVYGVLCEPLYNCETLEIIGNIFDNPELMENVAKINWSDIESEDFEF